MAGFESFIASGQAADVVLAVLLIEAAVLLAWRRLLGRGPGARDVAGTLLSGACMVLALKAALTGGGALLVAGLLSASFFAHLYDLSRRGPW